MLLPWHRLQRNLLCSSRKFPSVGRDAFGHMVVYKNACVEGIPDTVQSPEISYRIEKDHFCPSERTLGEEKAVEQYTHTLLSS